MTELAYLADVDAGYVRTFRARVVARPPGALVVDRTFFYPAGGGQPTDRGTVRDPRTEGPSVAVVDVVKSGASVVHRVKGTPNALASLSVGGEIEGAIDWERRHRHMRLHTGQHYLSARVFSRTGRRTRRAVLQNDRAYLDLDGLLPSGEWEELRAEMEELWRQPKSVRIAHIPRREWEREPSARSGLVPLPAHVDPIRVVEIDGIDRCPCGGTHVRSTAEVGPVELSPPEPTTAAEMRISFRLLQPSIGGPTPPE